MHLVNLNNNINYQPEGNTILRTNVANEPKRILALS